MEAARDYHAHGLWFTRLFLLMPHHVQALVAIPPTGQMSEVIRNWKRSTARKAGIRWQHGYFDHRLRGDEQWELKAEYIRQNPVRKGLLSATQAWPYWLENA